MKIPGWAYAAVGVAVALYSKFVETRNGSAVMAVFFWVGLALVAVGAFKLLIAYMTTEREPKGGGGLVCPRCNARLHPRSRFCSWCGARQ